MNLSHVIASLDARHGGPSKSTRSLAQAQAEQGARVDLFAGSDTPSRETRGQLTTTLLARGWLDRLGVLPGLVTHLRRAEPDLVHVHGLWLRSLGVAHEEAQTRAIPLVVSPRGMMSVWSWQHHRWRKHLAEHWLHPGAFSAAAGWHATSVEEAEEIRSHGFEQPVCVAPHGVDVPDAAALAEARRHWTQACPECARRPTALFYSRFHAKKRVLELIDLWLAQSPPEWLLLLVGVPEQYSVEALRSYVYRAGGSRRIEVFDGMNRPAPYAAASISLLPSHSENFGMVVAEALAAGVPALVTDSTPWKLLDAARAGWCVPWSDFGPALQAALAETPDSLQARGSTARAWAHATFAWSNTARTLLAFYEQLRSARGGARDRS
jgi:glycosyltransferase involved in cell wall biosynthesis